MHRTPHSSRSHQNIEDGHGACRPADGWLTRSSVVVPGEQPFQMFRRPRLVGLEAKHSPVPDYARHLEVQMAQAGQPLQELQPQLKVGDVAQVYSP